MISIFKSIFEIDDDEDLYDKAKSAFFKKASDEYETRQSAKSWLGRLRKRVSDVVQPAYYNKDRPKFSMLQKRAFDETKKPSIIGQKNKTIGSSIGQKNKTIGSRIDTGIKSATEFAKKNPLLTGVGVGAGAMAVKRRISNPTAKAGGL